MEKTSLIFTARAELNKASNALGDLAYSVDRGDPNTHENQIELLAFTKGTVAGALAMIDLMLAREAK